MINFYELLALSETASLVEIKKAIFDRKKKWTRQASNAPTLEMRRQAEDGLVQLGEAEKAFKDEATRKAYDEELRLDKARERAEQERYAQQQAQVGGSTSLADVEEKIEEAWSLYNRGRLEEATHIAFSVRFFAPTDTRLMEVMIRGHMRSGNDDAALLAASEACAIHPHKAKFQRLSGEIFKMRKDWKKAYRAFEKAYALDRSDTSCLLDMAEAASSSEDNDTAIACLEPLLGNTSLAHDSELEKQMKYLLGNAYLNKAGGFAELVPEGIKGIQPGYHYTRGDQIQQTEEYIAKAKALDIPELSLYIGDVESSVSEAKSRSFHGSAGSLFLAVLLGIILIGDKSLGACGQYLLLSSVFYFFASLSKRYVINRRLLNGDGEAFADSMMSDAIDSASRPSRYREDNGLEGCVGVLVGVAFTLALMPLFALGNFVKNYLVTD